MIEYLRRIFALIKKEFITIWKDPKSRGIIIAMPLLQLFVFANAITMEVKNIDVVLIDRDNSVESRELISRFEHSPRFRKFYFVDNEKDFKNKIDNQKVQIGIYINNDFSTAIKSQKNTNVLITADGRQTNSAAIAGGYASQIINDYNTEITGAKGAQINPVIRNWFNPNLEYRWYILTVIIAMLALVITLLLTALSIAREREMGTFDQLIVSPLSSFEILLGKTIPPLIIAMGLTCLMTLIIITCFKVPFAGSIWLFLVSVFVSLLSIVGVGLCISAVCKTQQQAILGVITFQMPAVLLSGFISPVEDMPLGWQYLTWINPVRFFMELSRGIFLKGMGVEDVFMKLIPLILIAAVTLSLAGWTFKRNLD
ncbi:MAG: ABC transporter permease [Candidatus Gastranaerophilaceae bacterium]|nr:putative transporter subunit: permease component of ABC superfamily [Clostridium sp. CAG:967]